MKIRDKILLHRNIFPQYTEETSKPEKFILITIIETREVPGNWNPQKMYQGQRALGEDGRYYLCNWNHFSDDSSSPTWCWQREMPGSEITQAVRDEDAMFYDVTQGMPFIPFVPAWLDKYKQFVTYCPIHQRLDYISNKGCFFCKHGPEAGIPEKDYSWLGWK